MDWWEILSKWLPIGASVSLVVFVAIQIGLMRINTTADLMLKFEDRFNSPQFCEARKATAKACLEVLEQEEKENQKELGFSSYDQIMFLKIFDFFETLGLLVREARIKTEIVWSLFGEWIVNYYSMFKEEISEMKKNDPSFYENLTWLEGKMKAAYTKRGIKISNDEKLEFFKLEASIKGDCEPSSFPNYFL